MNRWLLLIIGMSLIFSGYGQEIRRIETKLFTSNEEGQNDAFSSIDFDENGIILQANFAQVFPEYYSKPDSLSEFLILNLLGQSFDLSIYPVCYGGAWFDEFLQSTFSSCGEEENCSAKLEFDGEQNATLLISKDIIEDEIYDKFNPVSEKAPTLYYDRYLISFDSTGRPGKITSEDWISDFNSGSASHWFSYYENGLVEEYFNGDPDAALRYRLRYEYEGNNLALIEKSLRNQRNNSWEIQSSIVLQWEGSRLKSATKFDDEGRQQYVQEFNYIFY